MRLIHYSDSELQALHSILPEKQDGKGSGAYKPRGLWVSVEGDDDWPHWCRDESFHCGAIATEIVLEPLANVLIITDANGIDTFTRDFEIEDFRTANYIHTRINWRAVAEKYDGLIIAPYCWERRLSDHTMWYYGWDCASGCLWNMDAVNSFKSLQLESAQ